MDDVVVDWKVQLYTLLAALPRDRVVSYGGLAKQLDGVNARMVARAMSSLPAGSALPWHRVIRSDGHLADHDGAVEQRARLLADGIMLQGNRVPRRYFL
ncbi:MGMT family protein [Nitrincola sp. MINF-07-Sa-05]|uniref:MGMT family protein n=1 Tax=Nitrincola salilacus TaxID=3400273 RepID=UPI003917D6E6